MNTNNFRPASLILGFTGAASVLNILTIVVRSKFDIRSILNPEVIIYEIGLEGLLLIVSAALTYFISKRFNTFTLRTVSISAFIFCILLYAVFSVTNAFNVAILRLVQVLFCIFQQWYSRWHIIYVDVDTIQTRTN